MKALIVKMKNPAVVTGTKNKSRFSEKRLCK
jgi:hypothetical protein